MVVLSFYSILSCLPSFSECCEWMCIKSLGPAFCWKWTYQSVPRTTATTTTNWSNFITTTLRFYEKFDHTFSHIFIFGITESHDFISMLVTSSKIYAPIYPLLINEGRWNCSNLWPHSNKTVNCDSGILLPNIKTCENGWSNFTEKLSCGDKIAWVNSIHITKSINFIY